tara:strand:+ start:2670 stop:2801 length:132 start_codon:yes stop_codon:yes gene_type:complete
VSSRLSKLSKGTEIKVNTILGDLKYSDGIAQAVNHIASNQKRG